MTPAFSSPPGRGRFDRIAPGAWQKFAAPIGAKHPARRHQPISRTSQIRKKELQRHTTFGMINIVAQVRRGGLREQLRQPFRDFTKISNRCASLALQLDYREVIRRELPIGLGEVESSHRHILQKCLKIPGAW